MGKILGVDIKSRDVKVGMQNGRLKTISIDNFDFEPKVGDTVEIFENNEGIYVKKSYEQLQQENFQKSRDENRKKADKKITIVFLIFFAPVGIWYLWAKTNWKKHVKIGLTLLSCLSGIVVISLAGSTSSESSSGEFPSSDISQQSATSQESISGSVSSQEAPVSTVETTGTPDVMIKEKYSDQIDTASFIDGVLRVETKGEMTVWDENDFVTKYPREYFDIFWSGIFIEGVKEVEVVSYAIMNDVKGNSKRDEAINMTWSKETVANAEYENFKGISISRPENIYKTSKEYYIHLGIYKDVKDETKEKIRSFKLA